MLSAWHSLATFECREHARALCQQPKRWHHPKMAGTLSFLGRSELRRAERSAMKLRRREATEAQIPSRRLQRCRLQRFEGPLKGAQQGRFKLSGSKTWGGPLGALALAAQ
jgi:hypothetical protein